MVYDPNRLVEELYSEFILPDTLLDKIIEDRTSTTREKASKLLHHMEKSFHQPADNDGDCTIRFNKLCDALIKQDNPELTKLVQKMKL